MKLEISNKDIWEISKYLETEQHKCKGKKKKMESTELNKTESKAYENLWLQKIQHLREIFNTKCPCQKRIQFQIDYLSIKKTEKL